MLTVFADGAAVEVGGSQRRRCCSKWFGTLSPLPSFSLFFSSFFLLFSVGFGVSFFLSHFFLVRPSLTSLLYPLSLTSSRVSLSPLVSVFLSFFLPFLFFLLYIYRGERVLGPSLVRLGSGFCGQLVGHHPRQQRAAPLLSAGRAADRLVASVSVVQGVGHRVGGREERE